MRSHAIYKDNDYIIVRFSETKDVYTFQLLQGIEQEGYTAVTFSDSATVQNFRLVVKNAYAILSALRNSEEEE